MSLVFEYFNEEMITTKVMKTDNSISTTVHLIGGYTILLTFDKFISIESYQNNLQQH